MYRRIASVSQWLRFTILCALILTAAMPGSISTAGAAEPGETGSEYEMIRQQQVVDPDVVQPGDDDQPTIIGPRHGRRVDPTFGPVTTSARQVESGPRAGGEGLPFRVFVQMFLLRLGVMLR